MSDKPKNVFKNLVNPYQNTLKYLIDEYIKIIPNKMDYIAIKLQGLIDKLVFVLDTWG